MNEGNFRTRYPSVLRVPPQPSADVRVPRPVPPGADNPCAAAPPGRRPLRLRTGLVCLAAAGIALALLVTWRIAGGSSTEGTGGGLGQILGGGLLQGGLPPTRDPAGETGGETTALWETMPDEPPETAGNDRGDSAPGSDESASGVPSPQETGNSGDPAGSLGGTDTTGGEPPATGGVTDGAGVEPGVTEPVDGGTNDETDGNSDGASGDTSDDTSKDETEVDGSEPETGAPDGETPPPSVPAGCYPFVPQDMSQPTYGVGYVVGEGVELPSRLPEGELWDVEGMPAVLIINTHPYEGYGDGGDWYDPARGSLAQTSSPSASDGVVALGAELTRRLREQGFTVIHLRIAVSPEDSAADIYERTETVARYYCRLYPDIGLILNLRRSAELTETGGVLRTEGRLDGVSCAQLRISVSGGREDDAFGRDLAAALSLRALLWEREISLSRPVWAKTGGGFAADLESVRILTLEMGSAGNTFGEAARLLSPLTGALAELLNE